MVVYLVYGAYIITGVNSGVFYHAPIVLMSTMVLYIGYAANVQPDVFSGLYSYTNRLFPKYVKSGLTDSLSQELKENLSDLFQKKNYIAITILIWIWLPVNSTLLATMHLNLSTNTSI